MDPANIQKALDSFKTDPIKLHETKRPKTVVASSTYVSPIYMSNTQEPGLDELLEFSPTKDVMENLRSEPVEVRDLPNKYAGLQEFYDVLNDSTVVKSDEAKYALLAQMGLESGWGKKSAGSKYYNYGNITTGSSWKGDWFHGDDTDAYGNPIKQKFRKYANPSAFLDDYISLIKNLYPDAYKQLTSENFDIDAFTYGLRHGTVGMYAESPTYESSLRNVFHSVRTSLTEPEKTTAMKKGGILYNY